MISEHIFWQCHEWSICGEEIKHVRYVFKKHLLSVSKCLLRNKSKILVVVSILKEISKSKASAQVSVKFNSSTESKTLSWTNQFSRAYYAYMIPKVKQTMINLPLFYQVGEFKYIEAPSLWIIIKKTMFWHQLMKSRMKLPHWMNRKKISKTIYR